MSRNDKLPAGCAIPIFIIVGIMLYFINTDSAEEIKEKDKIHKGYINKYDYNPDTLAVEYSNVFDNYSDAKDLVKPKFLILYEYKNQVTFNPEGTVKLPDSLIAYKKSELKTIVLQSSSDEFVSGLWEHGVKRQQSVLKFIDFKSKKIIYKTTILGYHQYENQSRRGSTTEYHLYDSDIVSEILKIMSNNEL